MIAVEMGAPGTFPSNFEDRFVKTDFGDWAAICSLMILLET